MPCSQQSSSTRFCNVSTWPAPKARNSEPSLSRTVSGAAIRTSPSASAIPAAVAAMPSRSSASTASFADPVPRHHAASVAAGFWSKASVKGSACSTPRASSVSMKSSAASRLSAAAPISRSRHSDHPRLSPLSRMETTAGASLNCAQRCSYQGRPKSTTSRLHKPCTRPFRPGLSADPYPHFTWGR
jgi:hypothetical protein